MKFIHSADWQLGVRFVQFGEKADALRRARIELAKAARPDAIKVGITHGALAIPGKFQPNDFPIDPAAASRAGLDYLAIGHWHEWQVYDNGRLVMPGTPECDAFEREES